MVAVIQDNPVQNIGETAGYTFGVQKNFDEDIIKSITDDISVENGDPELKIKSYDSVLSWLRLCWIMKLMQSFTTMPI